MNYDFMHIKSWFWPDLNKLVLAGPPGKLVLACPQEAASGRF